MKTRQDCRHHWVVAPANGPKSDARCKLCGASREFVNNPFEAQIDRPAAGRSGWH